MRYMTIITMSACGMRWVRIGMVAIRQASVSRKVALPRPGVGRVPGAGSRRTRPWSTALALERAMHGRDGRGPDAEGLVRVLDLDAHGEARRQPDPVERALDAGQSIDAGPVLRQHGPAEPDDRASEMPARM